MDSPSSSYFLWEVDNRPVSILVNLAVIDRLERTLLSDPEAHGILYGRVDQLPGKRGILVVERLDHSKDLQRVGYYRTVQKADLSIGEADLASMRRYLSDPASVLMLIRPSPDTYATAGIFLWESTMQQPSSSHREIPLNRKSLEAEGVPLVQHPAAQDASGVEAVREPEPESQPRKPIFRSNPWVLAALAVIVLALLPTLIRRKAGINASRPPAVAQFGQTAALDLNAQRSDKSLRVTWNRVSPPIVDAERGVLWIKDGANEQRIDLDPRQLTTGSVIYWPNSRDVTFRLEVFGISKFASESVRALYSTPEVAPVAIATNRADVKTEVKNTAANPVTNTTPKTVETRARTKDEATTPNATPAPATQPPETLAAKTSEPPSALVPASASPVAERTEFIPEQRVALKNAIAGTTVDVEPVDESGLRKVVQTIPGLRSLQRNRYKAGDHFTPAKAIKRVTPAVPAALRSGITGEVPVDLRVSIDEEGNIFRTEVLSGKADNRLLNLAADAAKRWRFEPARIDAKPVPSKVLLHFTFKNPA